MLGLSGTDRLCLERPHDERSFGVGPIVAVPGGVVHCLEGLHERLSGTFAGRTLGLSLYRFKEHGEVLPSVDCAPGLVDNSPSSGRLGNSCGRPIVPRVPVPFGIVSTRTPFPPSGAPGGVLPRLLSLVCQVMAIAQLTHLHISIPASGVPPGQVPEQCFPRVTCSRELTNPRRVSFASGVTILGGEEPLDASPDILIHDPVCPEITVEDEMDIVSVETDGPILIIRPPPGFRQFSWPWEEWGPDSDPSLFNFSKELPGWFPREGGGHSVDPPSLPISQILQDSLDDSGSSREGVEHSIRGRCRHTN